mgnify:CR=1 FL=1
MILCRALSYEENTLDKSHLRRSIWKIMQCNMALVIFSISVMMDIQERTLLGLDSDTFYIYHVAAVMVDNLRRLLLGINLSDKAIMDFDFPGVGFPV